MAQYFATKDTRRSCICKSHTCNLYKIAYQAWQYKNIQNIHKFCNLSVVILAIQLTCAKCQSHTCIQIIQNMINYHKSGNLSVVGQLLM